MSEEEEPQHYVGETESYHYMGETEPQHYMGETEPHLYMGETEPHHYMGETEPHHYMGEKDPHYSVGEMEPHHYMGETEPHHYMGEKDPHYSVADTEAHRRAGHDYYEYGDDDLDYSSGSDGSDYGADGEDNDDYSDDLNIPTDPGPFRYNRKMVMVSWPCAVMVLTLVGEIFLLAASFGAGIILILDPKGEKKRCIILFTLLFVFCHILTIYSILPLLWLSVFNLFLIGVVNMYFILTGGFIALQFTYFRKFELSLAQNIEKALFSVYPGCCVILLTWAMSSLVSWELIPYILLAVGFIYLQMFTVPHTSSFKIEKSGDTEDMDVLPPVISLTLTIMYCTSGPMIYSVLQLINHPILELPTFTCLLHFTFVTALSVFLTTLLSIRNLCEYTGWNYRYVQYCRWVSGAVCTVLLYPVLTHFNLSSHFLPWLPASVALYAIYGALLSDRKFKVVSMLCLPVPCVLFGFWMTLLPWKIFFSMTFGMSVPVLYILLLVNCGLCFLTVYSMVYWFQSITEVLLLLECIVFTGCEMFLYSGSLYPREFLIITAAIILYTLYRLFSCGKMSPVMMALCCSVHVTKALVVIIYHIVGTSDQLSVYRCSTLFIFVLVCIRVISLEVNKDLSVRDALFNLVAISTALLLNVKPLLHIVCIYVLWEEPTNTDIMGLYVTVCGLCVVTLASLHLSDGAATAVRQAGVVAISLGALVLVLQPGLSLTSPSVLRWGDVCSVVLIAFTLLTDRLTTLHQIFTSAALAGIFPGIRLAGMFYSEDVTAGVFLVRAALYISACSCLLALLYILIKSETEGPTLEKCILSLGGCLGTLCIVLLMVDMGQREKHESVMSLPSWRLSLVTTGLVSVSLKVLSTTKDLLIPMVDIQREKVLPRLPLIGNLCCILAFLLACVQSPVRGLLHDIWCCAAALILICLQRDKRLLVNVRAENQIVPTIFVCISVLYISSIYHSDLWTAHSLSFLRAIVEVVSMLSVTPLFYVLWGVLWHSALVLSEQVVVFLVPLNAVYLLYASSYTSQALGTVGLFSGLWMMFNKLPLKPISSSDR